MALRDLPYLPLFVDDFMSDEKLAECSPHATGVYIWVMCVMKKSEEYGVILLKQKDKQSAKQTKNFAAKLARILPWSAEEVERGLDELLSEGVVMLEGDRLTQKRMLRDAKLSEIRSEQGKKGAAAKGFGKAKKEGLAKGFAKAKEEANTGMDIRVEYTGDEEMGVQGEEAREMKSTNHGIMMPWPGDEFANSWKNWKQYLHAQHGQEFRYGQAEEHALRNLWEMADGDVVKGLELLEYNMTKRHKHIFRINDASWRKGNDNSGDQPGAGKPAGNTGARRGQGGTIDDLERLKRGGANGGGERSEFSSAEVVE